MSTNWMTALSAGKVPEAWQLVRLKNVTTHVNRGVAPDYSDEPTNIQVFNQKCLRRDRSIDLSLIKHQSPSTSTRWQRGLLISGDIVVNSTGTGTLGRAGLFNGAKVNVIADGHVTIVRVDTAQVDSRYLAYLLATEAFYVYANEALAVGATNQTELNRDRLRELPIQLPPLHQQSAIADYLDRKLAQLQKLVTEQQRMIGALSSRQDILLKSALAESSQHPEDKLGRRTRIGNGSTPRRDNAAYWKDGNFPWLSSTVVNQDRVVRAEEFVTALAMHECHLPVVPAGSILVGLTGQGKTRGAATILDIDATINQHMAYLTPDPNYWDAEYLLWALKAKYAELRHMSDGNGSTKGGLTCEQLKSVKIPMPPLDAQRKVTDFLQQQTDETSKLIRETEHAIDLSNEHREALITAAVTGQLTVGGAA